MDSQFRSEHISSRKNLQYFLSTPRDPENHQMVQSSMINGQNQGRESYQPLDYLFSEGCQGKINLSTQSSQGPSYATLESSPQNLGHSLYSSPSTLSFSPNESPLSQQDSQTYPLELPHSPEHFYGSPRSGSCITEEPNDFKNKLRELETAMLGPNSDGGDSFEASVQNQVSLEPDKWPQMVDILRGGIRKALVACAKAISDNDMPMADWLITELRQMVSVSGEPIQRLGAYMVEGLVARIASSGSAIYKSLRCKQPLASDLLSYMHVLYEVCPYFKFGYLSANGAIAEALKGEDRVHIIDFQIAQGTQWVTLIQALAARPGGPPYLRITGVDDPVSAYARGCGLELVGQRLAKLAKLCNVPFEFNAAAICGSQVEVGMLKVRPNDALAVNFPFQLHHMPDESVSTVNHRDRLLRMIKSLNPKVVTLVEQESNTNTAPFLHRFVEVLSYYSAVFESIDVTLPRDSKERISVEQHCLARDIVNVIACEGQERVERHELLGKWKLRFMMAGFSPYPLSSSVNSTIKSLLEGYCENYRLEEKDGVLYLGWKNRVLVASCAWR
ncbi:hypothetical protein AMTRI_Chr10g230380 [Amborella trichopoda]|uniref:Uncharacterized protein n=1 Tax=Amborella trichopoda TaxID=13333 RepID=W1NVH5_AMBTC|nr:scarecrow-like protein 21 [Amborella trichopoda]ERM99617.1 hypothetical protein AMTR_s00088p00161000 [Amborella trichopoda]|eukprot:XP_006836764.1 scarecrow-like protein 21 [Amborella trichopoda]